MRTTWLCSYPKAGRTWLRFMLAHYMNWVYELGMDINLYNMFDLIPNERLVPLPNRSIPQIVATHGWCTPDKEKIVFLYRNVFDTLVSYYYHRIKQSKTHDCTFSEYVRLPEGLSDLIGYMDSYTERLDRDTSIVVSYEDLMYNPVFNLMWIVTRVGIPYVNHNIIRKSVEAGRFENMLEMELVSGFPEHDYDLEDVNARRMRSGQVGTYSSIISNEDYDYIWERCMAELPLQVAARVLNVGKGDFYREYSSIQ